MAGDVNTSVSLTAHLAKHAHIVVAAGFINLVDLLDELLWQFRPRLLELVIVKLEALVSVGPRLPVDLALAKALIQRQLNVLIHDAKRQ